MTRCCMDTNDTWNLLRIKYDLKLHFQKLSNDQHLRVHDPRFGTQTALPRLLGFWEE